MFKSLKERLGKWIKKNSEEDEAEDKIKEKPKEDTKGIKKKSKKESKKSDKKEKPKKEKKKSNDKNKKEELEEKPGDSKGKKQKKSIFAKILTEDKFNGMFDELEVILLENNVAYSAIDSIRGSLKEKLVNKSMKEFDLAEELKGSIKELLIDSPDFIETIKNSLKKKSPYVILFSGINGAGKTTTIAKVTSYLQKQKLSVCLVASDTFRAAAIQQLEEHAKRLNVPIIKKDYGADPASVAFDGIAYAKKNKIDVVLIDTAGRLQNRDSLMKEIEKISRVSKADMKIFLGESITGNDVTEQAKVFNETIHIDGIILSKADIDEKGGAAISVSSITGKPIFFLGTGQGYEDLEVFNKEKLIEKLGI